MGKPFSGVTNKRFQRIYLKISDSQPFENQDVLWLQASNWYADLRIGLEGDGYSFLGGRVTWQNPNITFHHDIDRGSGASEDVGRITLTNDGCLENGAFVKQGIAIPFEEKWRCQQFAVQSRVLLKASRGQFTGLEVQLGRDCIIILGGAAARFVRRGASWQTYFRGEGFPMGRRPSGQTPPAGWCVIEEAWPTRKAATINYKS